MKKIFIFPARRAAHGAVQIKKSAYSVGVADFMYLFLQFFLLLFDELF